MPTKPILFSTDMVQVLLAGRKTQTRRVIPKDIVDRFDIDTDGRAIAYIDQATGESFRPTQVAKYQPGDVLWVRETWAAVTKGFGFNAYDEYIFKADWRGDAPLRWRPSIHMPKVAARLFLRVTNVRAEHVGDISDEDAIAEGIYELRPGRWLWMDPATTKTPNMTLAFTPLQAFMWLWNKINSARGFSWAINPWVWAYTFEQVDKPAGWPGKG